MTLGEKLEQLRNELGWNVGRFYTYLRMSGKKYYAIVNDNMEHIRGTRKLVNGVLGVKAIQKLQQLTGKGAEYWKND